MAKLKEEISIIKGTLSEYNEKHRSDPWILLFTAILLVFGTVMIFSASYYNSISDFGDPYHYLKRQLLWIAAGTVIMVFFSYFDYHKLAKYYIPIAIICLVLLCLIFTPLSVSANGARRWIGVGPITLMPGELAKIGLIIFIAGYLNKDPKLVKNFWKGIMPVVGVAGVYAVLIMEQPNMSTAFTTLFIAAGMLFVAGIRWRDIAILLGALSVAGAGAAIMDQDGYRFARVTSFLDPFADALGNGWQVVQSLLAIGTGGLFGKGLGNSIQKNLYLPESQNDFILAIIGEELGFVGIFVLLVLYMAFVWRGCKIAMNAKDYLGMMLASGITIMIGIQVVLNVAVVTSTFPPTGIILPFVSYGGNALLIFMAAVGILLNISRQSNTEEA